MRNEEFAHNEQNNAPFPKYFKNFIKLFSGNIEAIGWHLLVIAFWSFLANILISFIANYIIQNRFKLKWRFLASAVFSALMAIYYALSETIFS